jgi:membrane protein YqaA with SNARE-associated domain
MTVPANSDPPSRAELVRLGLRWFSGLAIVFVGMMALASAFREPLEVLGRGFVERFGYPGMAFGTLIADGFHFPIPPQFYMLMAVTSGVSRPLALGAIAAGSLAGGFIGYCVAARLAQWGPIARRLERSQGIAAGAFSRFGYRAAIVASLLPIAYSVLCYLAGIHGLPRRIFAVLSLCRLPRLLLFFYLVELGWSVRW